MPDFRCFCLWLHLPFFRVINSTRSDIEQTASCRYFRYFVSLYQASYSCYFYLRFYEITWMRISLHAGWLVWILSVNHCPVPRVWSCWLSRLSMVIYAYWSAMDSLSIGQCKQPACDIRPPNWKRWKCQKIKRTTGENADTNCRIPGKENKPTVEICCHTWMENVYARCTV